VPACQTGHPAPETTARHSSTVKASSWHEYQPCRGRAKKPVDRELYMREHEYNNQVSSIRAPIERAVAHLKTWKILFTDYRRPLNTFLDSFRAAIGLYFFKLSFR
jgi:DDE superfamily endonuclease